MVPGGLTDVENGRTTPSPSPHCAMMGRRRVCTAFFHIYPLLGTVEKRPVFLQDALPSDVEQFPDTRLLESVSKKSDEACP